LNFRMTVGEFIGFIVITCNSLRSSSGVKHWEIIADNLSKVGWSWGCVSALDSNGRTIWIADANRDDGKRFVVRADEKLTAFIELESAIWGCGEVCMTSSGR